MLHCQFLTVSMEVLCFVMFSFVVYRCLIVPLRRSVVCCVALLLCCFRCSMLRCVLVNALYGVLCFVVAMIFLAFIALHAVLYLFLFYCVMSLYRVLLCVVMHLLPCCLALLFFVLHTLCFVELWHCLLCCALLYGSILCGAVLRDVLFLHCFLSCVSCLVLRGVVDDVVVALLLCCFDDDLAIDVL